MPVDSTAMSWVRCWNPSPEQMRAIHFYTALWIVGLTNAARAAGNHDRAARLANIAEEILEKNEQPGWSLQQSLSTEAIDPEQLLVLATNQHRAGNLADAQRLYRLVIEKNTGHVVARFRLGLLEMQQGNFESALALIQQSAATFPDEFRYQFGLGEVLSAMQRWEEAASAYSCALTIDPQSADAQFALGNAFRSTANLTGAIAAYRAAIQIQPDFADAFNNLGNCFKALRDLPEGRVGIPQCNRRQSKIRGGDVQSRRALAIARAS